jgi:hypothetical protein
MHHLQIQVVDLSIVRNVADDPQATADCNNIGWTNTHTVLLSVTVMVVVPTMRKMLGLAFHNQSCSMIQEKILFFHT